MAGVLIHSYGRIHIRPQLTRYLCFKPGLGVGKYIFIERKQFPNNCFIRQVVDSVFHQIRYISNLISYYSEIILTIIFVQ